MVTVPSATMQTDKWRFEEPTPPWRPTGDPVADTQQQQATLAATRSFHPLRQLYRDCLTNTFSVQSMVLALAILVAMYWATRLFLRLFFWLSDRYDAWRHGNAVVLAPFESEVSVCFAGCTAPPPLTRFSTQEYWEREYARCVGCGVAALSVLPVAHPSGCTRDTGTQRGLSGTPSSRTCGTC